MVEGTKKLAKASFPFYIERKLLCFPGYSVVLSVQEPAISKETLKKKSKIKSNLGWAMALSAHLIYSQGFQTQQSAARAFLLAWGVNFETTNAVSHYSTRKYILQHSFQGEYSDT